MNKEIEDLKEFLEEGTYFYNPFGHEGDEWNGFKFRDIYDLADQRWGTARAVVVTAPSGRSYKYEFFEGATENQDSEFYDNSIVEVTPVEKQITVVEWHPITEKAGRPGNPVAPTSDTVCIPCGF